MQTQETSKWYKIHKKNRICNRLRCYWAFVFTNDKNWMRHIGQLSTLPLLTSSILCQRTKRTCPLLLKCTQYLRTFFISKSCKYNFLQRNVNPVYHIFFCFFVAYFEMLLKNITFTYNTNAILQSSKRYNT